MYYENEFKCFEEFAVVIDEYIDHYNNQRIQEKTKRISPVRYKETSICIA